MLNYTIEVPYGTIGKGVAPQWILTEELFAEMQKQLLSKAPILGEYRQELLHPKKGENLRTTELMMRCKTIITENVSHEILNLVRCGDEVFLHIRPCGNRGKVIDAILETNPESLRFGARILAKFNYNPDGEELPQPIPNSMELITWDLMDLPSNGNYSRAKPTST